MSFTKWTAVAGSVTKDAVAGVQQKFRGETAKGYQSLDVDPELGASYARWGFQSVMRHGGLGDLGEMRVLELGPGDNQAFALCAIAAGADSVVGLDRFAVHRDLAKQREIYRLLRNSFDADERRRVDEVLDDQHAIRSDRVRLISGYPIEEAPTVLEPESFDLIFSVAVLEHLHDLTQAFDVMERLLAPGGTMLHQVDLRDHQTFSGRGLHCLTWLTVPDALHRAMVQNRGGPNRLLIDSYRQILDSLGLWHRIAICQVAGDDDSLEPHAERLVPGEHIADRHLDLVSEIRPKLRPQFRHLPDEDLLAAGLFIKVCK